MTGRMCRVPDELGRGCPKPAALHMLSPPTPQFLSHQLFPGPTFFCSEVSSWTSGKAQFSGCSHRAESGQEKLSVAGPLGVQILNQHKQGHVRP